MTVEAHTQIWINDHLDLINYAIQIGDQEWQAELVAALKEMNVPSYPSEEVVKEQLWRQYDEVLRQMLVIYEQLRNSAFKGDLNIEEQLWSLKLRRVNLAKQIKQA
ncbi:hypothetical protein SAMN04487969_11048 [Paenibacillus algorifonticola]|uniref:Uncharacterized protein n=1 Tax=Paenibacillus algorifonticola TaxID=684063 RepID=A0A1I2EU97_9BACL|nr:hypothetical protein [Paenibacillus algorifonticola]SFE96389.1 hypothetical protein SAMN04487969_11048 [Paenibacillus algorifonticola]